MDPTGQPIRYHTVGCKQELNDVLTKFTRLLLFLELVYKPNRVFIQHSRLHYPGSILRI